MSGVKTGIISKGLETEKPEKIPSTNIYIPLIWTNPVWLTSENIWFNRQVDITLLLVLRK
jgi:hypothetical protein